MDELKENEITLHVYKDNEKVLGRSDRQRRLIHFEYLCNCNFFGIILMSVIFYVKNRYISSMYISSIFPFNKLQIKPLQYN